MFFEEVSSHPKGFLDVLTTRESKMDLELALKGRFQPGSLRTLVTNKKKKKKEKTKPNPWTVNPPCMTFVP